MTYQRLGLAALVVSALRSSLADPDQQQQIDDQNAQIAAVRGSFDELRGRLDTLASALAANSELDAEHGETLNGIKGELDDLATALAGPADDDTDNGVIAEVSSDPDAQGESSAANAIVEAAPAPVAGDQGGEAGAAAASEQAGGEGNAAAGEDGTAA